MSLKDSEPCLVPSNPVPRLSAMIGSIGRTAAYPYPCKCAAHALASVSVRLSINMPVPSALSPYPLSTIHYPLSTIHYPLSPTLGCKKYYGYCYSLSLSLSFFLRFSSIICCKYLLLPAITNPPRHPTSFRALPSRSDHSIFDVHQHSQVNIAYLDGDRRPYVRHTDCDFHLDFHPGFCPRHSEWYSCQ